MRGFAVIAAMAALGIGAGAHSAPSYDGNFTARDCAVGGGFKYCGTDPAAAAPLGMGGFVLPVARVAVAPVAVAPVSVPVPVSAPKAADTAKARSSVPETEKVDDETALDLTDASFNYSSGVVMTLVTPPMIGWASPTSVPEPGAMVLLGSALALLGVTRARAKKTRA